VTPKLYARHALRLALFCLCLVCLCLGGTVLAQDTEDQAITLAAAHPALEDLLASYPGWQADAYDTGNSYGVWRVQFYFPSGSDLGWADVSPRLGEIFAWEASYELTGKLQRRAERTLYRFVRNDPRIRALVGDTDKIQKYFWYDSWREGWFVRLERGPETLDISIRSRFKGPLKLGNLFVEKIYLPNLLSYADYQAASRSSAVALAFSEPQISSTLRDKPGWTTRAEADDAGHWKVAFLAGDTVVAQAVVDLGKWAVRSVRIP
jgi:hypothetical protein